MGNPRCSAAVSEEVGMPERNSFLFVDKAGSKGHTSYTPSVPEEHPIVEFPPGIRDLEHWGRALVTTGLHKGVLYESVVGDSKYINFLIGARASLCTCSPPSSGKRVARDMSVDEGLVACQGLLS